MATKKGVAKKSTKKTIKKASVTKKVVAKSTAAKKAKKTVTTTKRKRVTKKPIIKSSSSEIARKPQVWKPQSQTTNNAVSLAVKKQSPRKSLPANESICNDCVEKKSTDTHSYRGWLNSDSFLKRALSITGYYFVGSLIVVIPIYIIMFLIVLIAIGISEV